MNLMVDIDDVIIPLAENLHRKAQEMGLHDGTEEALRVWHGHKQYGCTAEEWYAVFDALHAEDFYRTVEPYPGVAHSLRELYWAGHSIHLVTARGFLARGEEIRTWTREWKETHAIPGTLTFAQDKVAAQDDLGSFDAAIDDGAHNFRALHAAGVPVSLLTRPHNADEDILPEFRVESLNQWGEDILLYGDFPLRYLLGVSQ